MTTLIPIHSAAMFQVDQVRSLIVVGARSLFQSELEETSFRSSSKSRWVRAMSEDSVLVAIGGWRSYFSSKLTLTRAVIEICPSAIGLGSSENEPPAINPSTVLDA